MKRGRICSVLLMVVMVFGSVAWGVQMPQWIMNDRDLKSALKAAKTPEDHERIESYCQVKAERLDAEATGYEQAADSVRHGPMVKNLTSPSTAARYEFTARRLREQAQFNRRLAASHQQIADEVDRASK